MCSNKIFLFKLLVFLILFETYNPQTHTESSDTESSNDENLNDEQEETTSTLPALLKLANNFAHEKQDFSFKSVVLKAENYMNPLQYNLADKFGEYMLQNGLFKVDY